jgi:hypothetical protein
VTPTQISGELEIVALRASHEVDLEVATIGRGAAAILNRHRDRTRTPATASGT